MCGYGACQCEPREWSKAERLALLEHKEKIMQERLNYLRELKAAVQKETEDKSAKAK